MKKGKTVKYCYERKTTLRYTELLQLLLFRFNGSNYFVRGQKAQKHRRRLMSFSSVSSCHVGGCNVTAPQICYLLSKQEFSIRKKAGAILLQLQKKVSLFLKKRPSCETSESRSKLLTPFFAKGLISKYIFFTTEEVFKIAFIHCCIAFYVINYNKCFDYHQGISAS